MKKEYIKNNLRGDMLMHLTYVFIVGFGMFLINDIGIKILLFLFLILGFLMEIQQNHKNLKKIFVNSHN